MSAVIPKKRVLFCTYSSVYSSLVLKKLLLTDSIEVVGIINSTRVLNSKYGAIKASLKQIQLTGWRYSSYLFLITNFFSFFSSVKSLFERAKGDQKHIESNHLKTVSHYAKENDIPIVDTQDVNSQSVVEFMNSLNPDILLAAHFNQLVKTTILDSDRFSCINIHPSLLPDYKGVDPVFFALLKKEEKLGVSLHEMVETFDEGKVISQKDYDSHLSNNVYSHNCRLFETGAEMAIQYIENNNKNPVKSEGEGSYDSWPDALLVANLRKGGNRLINIKEFFLSI